MNTATARKAGARTIIGICFLIAALEGYDIQAFGVAAPRFAPQLGLDPAQVGWAGSAAMVGLVIGAFVGGMLADRLGRKPVLLISTVLFGAFSVATAFVADFDGLLWTRFLTGLGFGGAMPNLIAVATEISEPKRRTATVTMMFCGMPAGGAVVALISRYGGEALDWRTIFLIGGVAPLLITPLIHWLLPETRPQPDGQAKAGLAKALFGERRALSTLLLWLVFVLTLLIMYLMLNWLPTLVVAKGLTEGDGATASFTFNIASIVGALLIGMAVDRRGFRTVLMVSYALLALSLAGLSWSQSLAPVLILAGVAGFFVIGAQYVLYALAPALYPVRDRAAGAGAAVGVGRFGSILGPLAAGQLRAAGFSADQVFLTMVPLALVGVGVILWLTHAMTLDES